MSITILTYYIFLVFKNHITFRLSFEWLRYFYTIRIQTVFTRNFLQPNFTYYELQEFI